MKDLIYLVLGFDAILVIMLIGIIVVIISDKKGR